MHCTSLHLWPQVEAAAAVLWDRVTHMYLTLGRCTGYSLLGVCYELFLSLEDPRLPYSEYMYQTSRIGLVAVLLYQVVFVLPHWSTLVAQPLAAKGQPVMYSAVLYLTGLLLFGALYIVHSYCSAHLFQRDGAVAVNLANACRYARHAEPSRLLLLVHVGHVGWRCRCEAVALTCNIHLDILMWCSVANTAVIEAVG